MGGKDEENLWLLSLRRHFAVYGRLKWVVSCLFLGEKSQDMIAMKMRLFEYEDFSTSKIFTPLYTTSPHEFY